MTADGAALVLRAGADHMFALEDVDEALAKALLTGVVSRPTTPMAARDTFDQLVTLGALRPEISPHDSRTDVSIVWSGRPLAGATADIEAQLSSARLVASGASLLVYLRTTATLEETACLAAAAHPPVPHLLIDSAYHHTISLGPLVVPGDTSCLTCLSLRIEGVWGDARPPPEPAVTASRLRTHE